MKYEILQTRDFRGTLGLKYLGEVVEISDPILIEQLIGQELIKLKQVETIKPTVETKEGGK